MRTVSVIIRVNNGLRIQRASASRYYYYTGTWVSLATFQLPLSWSENFEPEFVDIALQIALSTVTLIGVRYHGAEDKEVMNLSRGAGPGYDPFVPRTSN